MKKMTALLIVLATSFGCATSTVEENRPPAANTTGSELIGGDFRMKTQFGESVTQEDFKGKYMLVFFGFARCSTVCPTGLNTIGRALAKLPAKMRAQIQPVFVTVDPEQDTPEVLKEYVLHFDKNFIALRGSQEEVDRMIKNYRGYYTKVQEGKRYTYDHSDIIYFMSKTGKYISHFSSSTGAEKISQKISKKIRGH